MASGEDGELVVPPDDARRHVEQWRRRCLRAGPLTAAERAAVEHALRRLHLRCLTRPPVVTWCTGPGEAAALAGDPDRLLAVLLPRRPGLRLALGLWRVVRRPLILLAWTVGGALGGLTAATALLLGYASAVLLAGFGVAVAGYLAARTHVRAWSTSRNWWNLLVPLGTTALLAAGASALGAPLVVHVGSHGWVSWLLLATTGGGALVGLVAGVRTALRPAPPPAHLVRGWTPVAQHADRRPGLRRLPRSYWLAWAATARTASADSWITRDVDPARVAGLALASPRDAWLADLETVVRVGWAHRGRVAVLLEPPVEVHAGPDGLYREAGPAVRWVDGTEWFALDGVRVPRDPADGPWTVEEIDGTRSTEARRVMLDRLGWDRYAELAGLELVASVPDPANAPHELLLYEFPAVDGVRLLVMTNGSPDADGTHRRYGEPVPAHLDDPVEAAAWQYAVPVEVYRQLVRRT